jgi:hypothetical protein
MTAEELQSIEITSATAVNRYRQLTIFFLKEIAVHLASLDEKTPADSREF